MKKQFKIMRNIRLAALLAGLLIYTGAWAQLPTAQQIASKMKIGWNLGNTLEATGVKHLGAIQKQPNY